MEVCPIRWTYSSLQKTHRPPPFPVSAVWQSVFQVGPPCLTHEEALLIGSSGSFPSCLRDSVFTAQGLSSARWGEHSLSTTDNQGEVFQRVEKRDNCIQTLRLFFIYIHLKEKRTKNIGVNDWIVYHSICKSNLNYFRTTKCQGVTGSHGYQG